jgi:hypothetical protein
MLKMAPWAGANLQQILSIRFVNRRFVFGFDVDGSVQMWDRDIVEKR